MVKFHFEIQQKHIDAGKPDDEGACPVVLAVKEAGHECKVNDEIHIDGKRFRIPQAVSNFVGDFDGGFESGPFGFDLTDEDLIDPPLIEEDDASL